MQVLSHSSRAFIWNADGLRGFLSRDIINMLKHAEQTGQLEPARKLQEIDIQAVENDLAGARGLKEKMSRLGELYPSLYMLLLRPLE